MSMLSMRILLFAVACVPSSVRRPDSMARGHAFVSTESAGFQHTLSRKQWLRLGASWPPFELEKCRLYKRSEGMARVVIPSSRVVAPYLRCARPRRGLLHLAAPFVFFTLCCSQYPRPYPWPRICCTTPADRLIGLALAAALLGRVLAMASRRSSSSWAGAMSVKVDGSEGAACRKMCGSSWPAVR